MAYRWNKQASVAYGYSMARLALNYYTYCEEITGDSNREGVSWADPILHQAVGAFLKEEPAQDILEPLRLRVGKEMEAVTAYADCFRIYEYALNRLERRFETDFSVIDVDDDEFVAQLMGFLRDGKDTAMMNQRIQMVIGQLPIRFTRQKFYSMVLDALSIYIGSDQSGLENMMYLLRTGAMVEMTTEQERGNETLMTLLNQLRGLSFRDLDIIGYRQAIANITCASELLYRLSDDYQILQDLINDLYVLDLTKQDGIKNATEVENARLIVDGLYHMLEEDAAEDKLDEIAEQLFLLEGAQESYYEKYLRLSEAPAYQAGEAEMAQRGRWVDKLLSASPFVSLEEIQEEKTVEKSDIEIAATGFFQQLEPIFAASPKPINRAIMATTLANLPICFHSLEEIQSYLEHSLASCTDSMEKETCMELLRKLMEIEEYALV